MFKMVLINLMKLLNFCVSREASKRVLGERHYDVQLAGGLILHKGKLLK